MFLFDFCNKFVIGGEIISNLDDVEVQWYGIR